MMSTVGSEHALGQRAAVLAHPSALSLIGE